MRHWQAPILGLLMCAILGCTAAPTIHTSAWLERILQPAGPTGPDVVQMDVALVERPLGDAYLNVDLWTDADEQVVALESKAIVEDNGFRIGQIGGMTPVVLQTLLTSEKSCADPRRLRSHAGKPTKLVIGPETPLCRFQIQREGGTLQVALQRAQCSLEVVASLTDDGRTRLRFVPQIHHGDNNLLPRPATDLSGWIFKDERPTERYPQFAWEVTLAPNEYVVVGGRYDRPETLGHQIFLRGEEATPVQRLLVIRTSRPSQTLDTAQSLATAEMVPARFAAISGHPQPTVRGTAP
jgi:hypothetical protein